MTPTTRAALPGITRRTVLEIAAEQGIAAEERDVWPAELHCADGAFVCGSGRGGRPDRLLRRAPRRPARHPIITRIQDAYQERTRAAEYRTELYIAVR